MRKASMTVPGLGAVITLIVSGCGDAPNGPRSVATAPGASQVAVGLGTAGARIGVDAEFARVAGEVPGFGGMFLDEDGTPTVFLMDLRHRAAAIGALARGTLGSELSTRGVPLGAMRVLQGRYDFLQLAQWRERLSPVLRLPRVVFIDIDEGQNRLVVGVEPGIARSGVYQELEKLRIPRDAVLIEETQPVRPALTLRDYVRPIGGALQTDGTGGMCTLGFSALRPPPFAESRFFLTNSHCTLTRGVVEGSRFWQNSIVDENFIGTEVADPPYSKCQSGDRCRFSDAAIIMYAPGVEVGLGTIMRTTFPDRVKGSLEIDPNNPRFFISAVAAFPMKGDILNKVGRTSGWTQGEVVRTCFDVNSGPFTYLCQNEVNASFDFGDSGSPVFGLLPGGERVVLYGIGWGLPFTFSSIENILLEFGPLLLTTIKPAVLIDDDTRGFYNDKLGAILDGTSELFPSLGEDPNIFPAREPDVSHAASFLGEPTDWLRAGPPPDNGSWTPDPMSIIPANWDELTETAIVYPIEIGPFRTHLIADFAVDNGIFVWVNGTYKFGAVQPGPAEQWEYSHIDLGEVPPGRNFIQILREDHGRETGYHVRITGVPAPQQP